MNFSEFLKNNETLQTLQTSKINDQENVKDIWKQDFFKRGDLVKIIYLENSILNYYKHYNGEIKTCVKNTGYATIVLEALNNTVPIAFPIEHFRKRTEKEIYTLT